MINKNTTAFRTTKLNFQSKCKYIFPQDYMQTDSVIQLHKSNQNIRETNFMTKVKFET